MRRLPLLLTAAVAAAAATGCDRTGTVRVPGPVVAIRIADYRYEPQNVSIRRGRTTFAVTNAGRQPTNFRIRRRRRDLATIRTLQPGEYGSVTVNLERGVYTMHSSVARNATLGEHGTLTVR